MIYFVTALILSSAHAASPPSCPDVFVLTKSENRNVLHYQARFDDGKLDEDRPLKGRWHMIERGEDQWEDWTWIERVMVFGVELGKTSGKKVSFSIKASSAMQFELDMTEPCPKAIFAGDAGPFVVNKLYIETAERLKVPDQMQVTVSGIDSAGKPVQKTIFIKQ